MSLFHKHDGRIAQAFDEAFAQGRGESEREFIDSLNPIVVMVEEDAGYSTNEKLRIYELLSKMSNCTPEERPKYAKKLKRALR
jgi:hypothetical protein